MDIPSEVMHTLDALRERIVIYRGSSAMGTVVLREASPSCSTYERV